MSNLTVALDAMGVIYRVGDDVGELLVPFIKREGGTDDIRHIEELYTQASLGSISSSEFWRHVGLHSDVEDRYLQQLELSHGVIEFLATMKNVGIRLFCLSNDVSEWSVKTRRRFGLEEYIKEWIISGDVHCRKPDLRIYRILLKKMKCSPDAILFVDDRDKNVQAARECGMNSIKFYAGMIENQTDIPCVAYGFAGVMNCVEKLIANS